MLSKRIVHFMRHELWWECRGLFTCECGTDDHYKNVLGVDLKTGTDMVKFSTSDEIQNHWQAIVEAYTTMSLTYSSDIFPALQGLAKLVPPSMGRYLAGHWGSTLIRSLCWYSINKAQGKPREWRAPSWSWAAAQGGVVWPYLRYDRKITAYVTVLSAMTIPKGDDPMGQISYGAIVLKGKYLVGEIECSFSISEVMLKGPNSPMWKYSNQVTCHPIWDIDQEMGTQVIALKIFKNTGEDFYEGRNVLDSHWLILKATKDVEGEYMRVGTMKVDDWGYGDSRYRELDALYKEESVEMDFKIV
jgi:hypothetical protein